jgi:hypothetical protein
LGKISQRFGGESSHVRLLSFPCNSKWEALVIGGQYLVEVRRLDLAKGIVVHDHSRSQAASTQTSDCLQRKATVGGGLTRIYFENGTKLFHDFLAAPNITRSPQTHPYGVSTPRNHGEKGIEGHDPVHLAQWQTKALCHFSLDTSGKVSDLFLNFLENRDQ